MSRERDLAKNFVIMVLGESIPLLCSLLILHIYTASLSKIEYGTYDLLMILSSVLVPILSVRVSMTVLRYIIDARDDEKKCKRYISTALFFVLIMAFIGAIFVSYFIPHISIFQKVLTTIYFVFCVFQDFLRQVSRGFGKMVVYVISACIFSILMLSVSVLLLWKGFEGLNSVLIANCLALVTSNIYLAIQTKTWKYIDIKYFSASLLKEFIKFSFPMMLNSVMIWIVRASDRFLITLFLGIEANAIYAVANQLPNYMTNFMDVFNKAWQENASVAYKDRNAGEYFEKITRIVNNAMIGISALLMGFMPMLFKIFISDNYSQAYNQIAILIWGVLFSCMTTNLGSIFFAVKQTKTIGNTTFLGALINILINLFLINKLGIFAASISTLVSYLLIFYYRVFRLKRLADLKMKWKSHFVSLLLLGILTVLYYYGGQTVRPTNMVLAVFIAYILNRELIITFFEKCKHKANIERGKNNE